MLSPQEITQTILSQDKETSQKKGVVGVIRAIVSEAKDFFNGLLDRTSKDIKSNTFKVQVENQIKLPDTQRIDGEVSIKDYRALLIGLNEVKRTIEKTVTSLEKTTKGLNKELKPEKINLQPLIDAVDAIEIPETKIPEYPKEMSISNFKELKKSFDDLSKKFDIKAPVVNVPAFPKKIEVSNFPEEKEQPKEEEMTGLVFKRNELGDVTDIIEKYPSGDVVSSGWSIGIIKVTDGRKSR